MLLLLLLLSHFDDEQHAYRSLCMMRQSVVHCNNNIIINCYSEFYKGNTSKYKAWRMKWTSIIL